MDYLETISCVLCGYENNRPFSFERVFLGRETHSVGVNKCKMCNLVYVSPRLNSFGLAELYDKDYDSFCGVYCGSFDPASQEYQRFQSYVHDVLPQGGKILDVGCGTGNFLSQFVEDHRYGVEGLELSRYAGQEAVKKGIRVHFGEITEVPALKEQFDALTLLYVLEHVPQPLHVLQEAYGLLKPGGYCLIAVPNYNYLQLVYTGLVALLLFRNKTALHAGEHLQNFTPSTLMKMVKKTDFEVVRWECASPFGVGSRPVVAAKTVLSGILRVLFFFGVHLGGIHLILRKV
jgi:2-polyprenyl-3-methyl-5-hydroxy-6-metoxy-1,4-benzoquinol methylase